MLVNLLPAAKVILCKFVLPVKAYCAIVETFFGTVKLVMPVLANAAKEILGSLLFSPKET